MISQPNCYRCRETIIDIANSIDCSHCYRFWHLNCLIDPIDEKAMLNKDWKCPQHDGRSYARRHKLMKKHGQIIKVDQPKEDLTFPEADKVVDYGGIIHNLKSSEIESDFLNYARKYRNHQSLCSARGQIELEEANEWLESLQTFQLQDIPHFRNDGIQMLLDAANMDDSLSMSSQSTMPEEVVIIDHLSYERYQAIEELIQLKGQDELMGLLK